MNFIKAAANPVGALKAEALKIDVVGVKGVPDVLEACDAVQEHTAPISAFLSLFDESDYEGIIRKILPENVEAKVPPGVIENAAKGFANLPKAITGLKAASEALESELKKK